MSEKLPKKIYEELARATEEFRTSYVVAKQAESDQTTARADYFAAFDKALESKRLPRKVIEVTGDGDAIQEDYTVQEFVDTWYPGWRIVKILNDDFPYQVQIERDPATMKWSWTNPETKITYQRSGSQAAAKTDLSRLQENDPELWEAISEWPPLPDWLGPFVASLFAGTGVGSAEWGGAWDKFCEERGEEFGIQRQLKPSDSWTDEQAAAVQKYLIPGKWTMKIVAPRAANEDELAELELEEAA